MVSGSCAALTGVYTLPILRLRWAKGRLSRPCRTPNRCVLEPSKPRICSAYSIRCILGLGKLEDAVIAADWPSTGHLRPSVGLLAFILAPVSFYGLIRGRSGCESLFCWQVEDQTGPAHARNCLHLVALSVVWAWLCRVPPQEVQMRALFLLVAAIEFVVNKYFWLECDTFMAHSLSAGSSFGLYDLYIATATLLSVLMVICEGLPSSRKCLGKLSKASAAPELYLNYRGQRNYLIFLSLLLFGHGLAYVCFPNDFHLHHYWMGFLLATCCIFPTPLSRLLLLKGAAWKGLISEVPSDTYTFLCSFFVVLRLFFILNYNKNIWYALIASKSNHVCFTYTLRICITSKGTSPHSFQLSCAAQEMMVIDGIAVWGADSILGADEGGLLEGDRDYRSSEGALDRFPNQNGSFEELPLGGRVQ